MSDSPEDPFRPRTGLIRAAPFPGGERRIPDAPSPMEHP